MDIDKMIESAKKHYLEEDLNCAETVLKTLDEAYSLELGGDVRIVGGFGAGLGCGSTCGVLSSCAAAAGRRYIKERAHESDRTSSICKKIVAAFKDDLGGTDCSELRPKYVVEGQRCFETVKRGLAIAAKIFDEEKI